MLKVRFPDVFGKYMTLLMKKAVNLVNMKIQKGRGKKRKKNKANEKEKDLERERQHILEQKNYAKS